MHFPGGNGASQTGVFAQLREGTAPRGSLLKTHYPNTGFLNLGIVDVWGPLSLLGGTVHCGVLKNIPGLYPGQEHYPHIPPAPVVRTKMSPDVSRDTVALG